MKKEKLITQFKGKTFSSNEQVIRWLEKALAQTREETIREAETELYCGGKIIIQDGKIIKQEDFYNKLKKLYEKNQ